MNDDPGVTIGDGNVPIVVQPQPTETQFFIDDIRAADGTAGVMLRIFTVLGGPFVLFLTADFAAALGDELKKHARQSASGLIVAPPGMTIPPHPNGNHRG